MIVAFSCTATRLKLFRVRLKFTLSDVKCISYSNMDRRIILADGNRAAFDFKLYCSTVMFTFVLMIVR